MGFDIVWDINIDNSESVVIDFIAQNNFPAPLADLSMFHINVERRVKQDKSTATIFCAVTKHYFTTPFGRPHFFYISRTKNLQEEDDLELSPMQPSKNLAPFTLII